MRTCVLDCCHLHELWIPRSVSRCLGPQWNADVCGSSGMFHTLLSTLRGICWYGSILFLSLRGHVLHISILFHTFTSFGESIWVYGSFSELKKSQRWGVTTWPRCFKDQIIERHWNGWSPIAGCLFHGRSDKDGWWLGLPPFQETSKYQMKRIESSLSLTGISL